MTAMLVPYQLIASAWHTATSTRPPSRTYRPHGTPATSIHALYAQLNQNVTFSVVNSGAINGTAVRATSGLRALHSIVGDAESMTTGFVTEHGGGGCSRSWTVSSTPALRVLNTGFVSGYRGLDLGRASTRSMRARALPFNTGFIAYDGRDLADGFAPLALAWPIGLSAAASSCIRMAASASSPPASLR